MIITYAISTCCDRRRTASSFDLSYLEVSVSLFRILPLSGLVIMTIITSLILRLPIISPVVIELLPGGGVCPQRAILNHLFSAFPCLRIKLVGVIFCGSVELAGIHVSYAIYESVSGKIRIFCSTPVCSIDTGLGGRLRGWHR